jgi:hypothetical protein
VRGGGRVRLSVLRRRLRLDHGKEVQAQGAVVDDPELGL